MHIKSGLETKFLLIVMLAIFLLPLSSAGKYTDKPVEMEINGEDVLFNEDPLIFQGGNDLTLIIRLDGDYHTYDSENENLSVQKISVTIDFLNDDDNRGQTSGSPRPQQESNDATITYIEYESIFRESDPIFRDYAGDLRFSILLKNDNNTVVKDEQFIITIESSATNGDDSGGFSLPNLSLPEPIQENLIYILGGIVVIIILSVGIYTFVLAPEDTTADLYKEREAINPLSKSLTGVDYESDLPGDEEDEEDDEYEDIEEDDEDDDFDESELLASLTGGSKLKDSATEEKKPEPKKKPVKRKVAKKAITKKKIVRKAAPPKKISKEKESEVNMGKGIQNITCPACEKVHHVEETLSKFICSCGRRIRV